MSLAIIRSKVQAPPPPGSVLERPRLLRWLERHHAERVVLISAEAGFGKTTLLADLAWHSAARCLWYRTETSDRDWVTFLSYLVAAVRESEAGFGQETEALLRHVADIGPSRDVVLASFLSELSILAGQRTILILDDVHHVDHSEDVHEILRRLFEHSPPSIQFVLASRRRPGLPLGRIAAHGRLAELGTDDLRFTSAEIEELFRSVYRQPLDADARRIVEERTEGWAASLQLVSASIAAGRPSQVAAFIQALSGAQRPIYDFLAEEVMARLTPDTQRVLMAASLLEQVTPPLVVAALSATQAPMMTEDVVIGLREAVSLGLLSKRQAASGETRFHPLLRQFLERQLEQTVSAADIKSMHRAVAAVAEASDWLTAGRHYALARESAEAMRVLGAAAYQALGTGTWGAAAEIIDSLPDATPPPAVQVLRARNMIGHGRPAAALGVLGAIGLDGLSAYDASLVRLTRATALHGEGDAHGLLREVANLALSPETPTAQRELASAWYLMLLANHGGSIADASQGLSALSGDLAAAGLAYFAGVALHNAANAELARGSYVRAASLADEALIQLDGVPMTPDIRTSTEMVRTAAQMEVGGVADGLAACEEMGSRADAMGDALAEAAYLAAVCGDAALAQSLLARLERGDAVEVGDPVARYQAVLARVALALARSDKSAALAANEELRSIAAPEVDYHARTAAVAANLAVMTKSPRCRELVDEAIRAAATQQAWRWGARARILDAASAMDKQGLRDWMDQSVTTSALAIHETAEVVAQSLWLLDSVPDTLELAVRQAPARWLPLLRHELSTGAEASGEVAAILLSRHGTAADAAILRAYETRGSKSRRRRGLAASLVRRLSPVVRVHDLGRTMLEVNGRLVALGESRRKAAALFLYLVTRQHQSASREQVMEEFWPDQSPRSASNSLHQTLFFLRRDIEAAREQGPTADYVRMESDLIYLNPELVQIDSVAFHRQGAAVLATRQCETNGREILRLYTGKFAQEFEYEDWAEEWRGQVHAVFLRLAHETGRALIDAGRFEEASDALSHAVTVDPSALDVRAMLVRSLGGAGAVDAAQAQYRVLTSTYERETGESPPAFEHLTRPIGDAVDNP